MRKFKQEWAVRKWLSGQKCLPIPSCRKDLTLGPSPEEPLPEHLEMHGKTVPQKEPKFLPMPNEVDSRYLQRSLKLSQIKFQIGFNPLILIGKRRRWDRKVQEPLQDTAPKCTAFSDRLEIGVPRRQDWAFWGFGMSWQKLGPTQWNLKMNQMCLECWVGRKLPDLLAFTNVLSPRKDL